MCFRKQSTDEDLFFFFVSMAVPFVQDWDVVQTLGEGAYGEYGWCISTVHDKLLFVHAERGFLLFPNVFLLCIRFQSEAVGEQTDGGGCGSEGHRYLSGQRLC